jgi:uncharacterized membrane protein
MKEQTMRTLLLAGVAALSLGVVPVLAQTTVEEHTTVVKKNNGGAAGGAVAGAATGAVVGGPIGAAVGAVAGAVVGHSAAPPTEVRTYVTTQNVPTVTYGQPVAVGRVVDSADITWLDVPRYPAYRWAYLDGHRVLVDAQTHEVVAVY